MQNPIGKLVSQVASLDAACLSAAFEENENVFACMLLEPPRSRLSAIANGLSNLKIDGRRVGAIGHMTTAQSITTDLLDRFAKCSERHLNRVVRRGEVMALLADVRAALPGLRSEIVALDGCCSELADLFD